MVARPHRSTVWSLDSGSLEEIAYQRSDRYQLMKDFPRLAESGFRHLFNDSDQQGEDTTEG